MSELHYYNTYVFGTTTNSGNYMSSITCSKTKCQYVNKYSITGYVCASISITHFLLLLYF